MAVTPDTTIKLLKVPIEIDNMNQLTFATLTDQYNYFNGCTKLEEEDLYYQRKDNYILWPAHIDTIIKYNYCMYQNSNYSEKWFYAFITNMEYENDGTTKVYIETDVYQSWLFDITMKACFVEREHVNDDTIGKNLVPENLQLGEYVCNKKDQWLHENTYSPYYTGTDMCIVVGATTDDSGTIPGNTYGVQTDGIYAGLRYYVFTNDTTGIPALNTFITNYATSSHTSPDAIKCIFMMPKILCSGYDRTDHLYAGSNYAVLKYINDSTFSTDNKNIDLTLSTLDSYTPINNKLKTFPYCYMLVSNNSGSDVIYRYEDFYTVSNGVKTLVSSPQFKIASTMTPSGAIRMIPKNYKGVSENDIEGINLGKFPVCSWATDIYTNWLTQNGVNIGLSVAGSVISGVAGAVTGNPIGVASGILGVANTLGEIYKESMVPPQCEGNINSGDVSTATGNTDFHFQVMTIKKEMAQIIDSFFSMYGYKVNSLKIPNVTGRTYWNYVKTIDCNIEGDIPQNDLQKIKDIFNGGVTFWHDATKFLDYTQSNTIVT